MTEPDPSHVDRRLTSLEEAAMFHEQAVGDSREAAEEALRRLVALEKRLAAMEQRLGALFQNDPDLPEFEKPPHSAG
ncbi:MAG: hypothetical protein ACIAQU_04580 [Phycisphaerales bacterium JB064]